MARALSKRAIAFGLVHSPVTWYPASSASELDFKMPGFDKDHWPSMTDMNWATQIHSYYGQPNYWEPPPEI